MKKILVLGGTGFVGRHLCEKLNRAGIRVTLSTRKLENARQVQSLPLVDVIVANVHVESELVALMTGVDAVVNLVAILHGSQGDFTRAHVTLPQTLVRACQAAGVKRVVQVSALGAALDAPSMYQRSKAQGEQVLQSAGLNLTVLRPSVIFGAEDKFLNVFAKLQQVFPVIPLAGAGTKFQPVWVEDVAQAVVNCLMQPTTSGHIYEACGPDVFTLAQLVQLAGRVSGANRGQGRPVFPLPLGLGRLQATLMSLAPGEPLMSRDNLDSMAVDNVSSGQQPGLVGLGITASSLAGVAPSYLSIASKRSVFQNLRARAGRG